MSLSELFLELIEKNIRSLGDTQMDVSDAHIRYYEEQRKFDVLEVNQNE